MNDKSDYKRLSLDERITIQVLLAQNKSFGQIAAELQRDKSAISREVSPWGRQRYKAAKAHQYAQKGAAARKRGKLKTCNEALTAYIHDMLALRWSPEQISHSLKAQYPDQLHMQLSHETIYRYVYLHCKKSLR